MKRLMMLILALVLALLPAAQAELETEMLLPDEGPVQMADSELRHAAVKSLFLAAAGTDFESESALIEALEEQEKIEEQLQSSLPPEGEAEEAAEKPLTLRGQRRAELAQYRAQTLPWLLLAFDPEAEIAEVPAETDAGEGPEGQNSAESVISENAESLETPEPEENSAADADPAEAEESVWTPEMAWVCFSQTDTGRSYLALMESLGAVDAESGLAITQTLCRAWMAEVSHEELAAINGDYACWLYCADTQIDYPVVHGADNSYYLNRLFNGAKNSGGTLFVDYRNLPGFQDPNTLIYGHHMRNDSMFGILTEYERPGFYESHPYVLMLSADEIAVIELFAGYTTSEKDHCYDIAISGEEDMAAFVAEAEGKSDFETYVEILTHDRLATLSTCAYSFRNARYIVIGKINSVWQRDAYAQGD